MKRALVDDWMCVTQTSRSLGGGDDGCLVTAAAAAAADVVSLMFASALTVYTARQRAVFNTR